jgi:hypothetical protein
VRCGTLPSLRGGRGSTRPGLSSCVLLFQRLQLATERAQWGLKRPVTAGYEHLTHKGHSGSLAEGGTGGSRSGSCYSDLRLHL